MDTRYLTPFSASGLSPAVPVNSLAAMVEASNMEPENSDTKGRPYDLSGKRYPINKAVDNYIDTSDWSFMSNDRASSSNLFGTSIPSHCPSLASGSTISSRNSSTRSAKSLRWPGLERLAEIRPEDVEILGQQDPEWDDGRSVNSKLLLSTHDSDRPYKCPIKSCEYHLRGFARPNDRVRHTNTHLKGTLICGFCSVAGTSTVKMFNRQDVFLRHLISVHGAKHVSPEKQRELYSTGMIEVRKPLAEIEEPRKSLADKPVATCNLCSEPFDAQGFYDHLPGCAYRQIVRDSEDAYDEYLDHIDTDDTKDIPGIDSPVSSPGPGALVPSATPSSPLEDKCMLHKSSQLSAHSNTIQRPHEA